MTDVICNLNIETEEENKELKLGIKTDGIININVENPVVEVNNSFNSKTSKIYSRKLLNIILLTLNASTGFFFFGYNLACFNTMQENLSVILQWTESNKIIFISIISAILPFGSIFGALISGKICALIGRRVSFVIYDILGIISTLLSLIANTYVIIIAKFIQGFCVGSFSTIVPLYVNEYVPKELSGLCGIVYNTNFCLGILVSFLFGLNLPEPTNIENNWWRFMFFFSSIPCLINLINMLFFVKLDTPYYLITRKHPDKAKTALGLIYREENEIKEIIEEMNKDIISSDNKNASYKELCSSKYSRRLSVCILLNIFQQLTLINPIGLYSNLIFLKSTDQKTATIFTALTGVAELVGSILTIFAIEKLGRKTLFIFGFSLTFLSHLTISLLYFYNSTDAQKYIIVFFYLICGISVDPIIWIYNADVLPDKGVGLCTMTNWIVAVIIIAVFPFLLSSGLKPQGTFLLFSLITLVGVIFAFNFMKESKGKTQAQIEKEFNKFC